MGRSYTSYRAMLRYLYTDTISFAPFLSNFAMIAPDILPSVRELFSIQGAAMEPTCNVKAIYRLADKIGLASLKERAREHISKSLTVENVSS
jgi:hypothetical protein